MATRVLIVDDHRIIRDGLRLRLQQEPEFELVGEAADIAGAYACLERMPVDVVVLDLNLGGDSGMEALGNIVSKWPSVKIVVLTGDTAPASAHDAMLAGASAYLRKEDAADELVRAFRAVMGGKTYLSPDAATAVTGALRSRADGSLPPGLSEQELAVLKGMAAGQSYKEIASDLNVSPKSIETYRARLVKKTGCTTRAELVRYAIRHGIVRA